MAQGGQLPSEGSIRLHVAFTTASEAALHVEAMLARLETTTDPRERATLLVDIAAALRDDLGDEGQAVDALLEAWRADPAHEPILDHLEPLLRSTGRWSEVLELTRQLATVERDARRAIVFAETMVRWLTRDVPDPELARQWLERVRQLDSTHALVHMLQAAVSREHGDLKRELDELDRAVLSARRADERARIHLLMATRYLDERTASLVEAKKHYAAAHKLFPRTMDPLRGLEDLAIREGDKVALADVLRRQSEADVETGARVTILLRLAALEEKEFRKPEVAAQTLERVIIADPSNEGALEGLERCYTAARMWAELAQVLERGAASAADAATRGERLKRLGEVLESKLGDVRAAIATYERLAATVQDDELVLTELARLAEKAGDVPLAVRARENLALLARDRGQAARNYVIAGQLLAPIDADAARKEFERAVAADPSNQAAWNALLWDARAEDDTARVIRYLEERARRTEAPRARAAAYVELAEARAKAGDADGARQAFEQATAADPTNESAAGAIVTTLVAEGRYAEAEASCDVAISAAERDRDYERLFALRCAQVEIARALGNGDRALVAARAAYELKRDSAFAAELFALAAADMRADPLVLGVKDLLVAIAEQPEGLSTKARVDLADVLVLVGEADRAAVLYDEVLAEEPNDERALAGLAQHHTAQGNPVAALALKRQLARGIHDEAERFATFLEVAEAFLAKAGSDELAAEVYEEARLMRPRDLPVLHKLLALYQKMPRWASVFDVLRSIAEADADPVRRTKTLYTMAQIAKEELADRGTALELFEQALDVDPSFLVAFEGVVAMLTEERDFLGLERIYKRMLARTDGARDPVLRRALCKQLGLIYRDRLKRHEPAIQCFQAAVQLDAHDEEAQAMLRELLARHGQADSAVAITIDRVLREPLDPAPYPALFDLLVSQGARDRALSVASAMRFLDVPHPAAQNHRASYPQPPIEAIVMDLGPDGYRDLLHEELDPSVTEIFEVVAPAVVDIALSRLSIRERLGHPGPSLKGQDWLTKAVLRSAQILGAPAPKLYARRTPGPALTHAPTKPPSLLVYPQALGGVAGDVTAFLVAKRVVEVSPPLLARALCPSITELKALGASAARIATNQAEAGDAPLRERLSRGDVSRIAAAVERAMSKTAKLDVLRWSQLAGVSAARAGLLVAGDLEAARAAMALEPQAPGDLTPREKMKELVAWYLGDACAAARRRIGVAL